MRDNFFLVHVRCSTYNQAPYICDALNGFTMQQTSFPFVCTIIDDSSTDGEPDIIKSYLKENFKIEDKLIARNEETDDYILVFAQHKENKNCYFAVYFLKYNHYRKKSKRPYLLEWSYTKYCAICEGDDFWTSPHKLQRQVDFLESHPEHSLCFHAHFSLRSDGTKRECYRYKEDTDECPMSDMILAGGGFMATASMVYVRKLLEDWPEWAKRVPIGDAPLMLVLAARGRVGYLNEIMSCYRVDVPGSWSVRVSKNKEERKKVHPKILQYKKDFDKWTDYKYHESVRKAIFISNLHYYANMLPIVRTIIKIIRRTR